VVVRPRALLGAPRAQARRTTAGDLFETAGSDLGQALRQAEEQAQEKVRRGRIETGENDETSEIRESVDPLALALSRLRGPLRRASLARAGS
jgi:hypothetical protein